MRRHAVSPARLGRALVLFAGWLVLPAGPAFGQEPPAEFPRPMPAPNAADLERLKRAAQMQAPPQPAGSRSAADQRAMPGLTPRPRVANQAPVIQAVKDRLSSQYAIRPGTPAYSFALQDELYRYGLRQAGRAQPAGRPRAAPRMPAANSVTTTPVFQRNLAEWEDRVRSQPNLRVIGGTTTERGQFLDCVAILGDGPSCGCSGTLIGPNVVLTAAHCVSDGCVQRVFIGNNVADKKGKSVPIRYAVPHPDYVAGRQANDIAVLILAENADGDLPGGAGRVAPTRVATRDQINAAKTLEVVGFGRSEVSDFGMKSRAIITISSHDCTGPSDGAKFECTANTELVAGGAGLDTCNGDSGGPAYILVGGTRYLAGVTVRGTPPGTPPGAAPGTPEQCGDGGVYTRPDAFLGWIQQTATRYNGRLLP